MRIVKTNREVGTSRILGDLFVIITDLQKAQQKATYMRNVICNQNHSFAPNLPDKIVPTVDISGNQGWAEVLGVQDDLTKLSAPLEEENVEKIIDISRRENEEPPGRLEHDSPQQSSDFPEHSPVEEEGRPKRSTRVPTRYQVFALFSSGYVQEYEKEKREVFKDCWIFRIKRDLKGEIVHYKACKVVKSYPHRYGDNHHFGMGVT